MELPNKLFKQIVSIINRGKGEYARKRYVEALGFFKEAEAMFPSLIDDYQGAEELCILIGNTLFEMGDFEKSREYYQFSLQCIDKQQSLLANFKIGKTYYQQGEYEKAKYHFQIVFAATDKEYFMNEDAKYYYLISEE